MRWGLLGTGSICQQFARDIPFVSGAVNAAVASREIGKAKDFANRYGVDCAYGSYAALLADPSIDVVYIGTPHTEHLVNARDALLAGKHVVCEKPLTVTPDEALELLTLHADTGLYLMEAMWTWFLPTIAKAQEWIKAGRIGALQQIKADFGYPQRYDPLGRMYNPALAGGCLLDMGVYPVALTWLLHKQLPNDVQVAGRRAPSGVDDDFTAILNYDGHTATLGSSFRCKLQNWAYIIGTEGYIALPDFWRGTEAMLFHLDTKIEHFKDSRLHQGFAYEADAAQKDIAEGLRESPVIGLADSLAIQELMQQIRSGI